jgi:serine/threonine protein kinase/Flp pilus assembly protein TadD
MIGETVSRYRIVEELGSGGMGVVYRAWDLHLGRDVALKFLPPRLAEDPAALARFDREARLASSLNHPHICTIHDVDQHEGRTFIVMELCSGETLKRLLEEGPIPLERAVDLVTQAASALGAAHRRGIVHRDVKPANLFVTSDEQLKVLDFGLAKLAEPHVAAEATPEDSVPSLAAPDGLTRPGMALGTVAYMSPEQALGRPVDARSDLFSLGAVLYEMVTGERAFPGPAPGVVFDRILNREPQRPRRVNPALPRELEALILRLLAKAPDERYQDAAALLADLDRVKAVAPARYASGSASTTASGRSGARSPARRRGLWLAAVVALVALIPFGILIARRPAPLSERDQILLAGFENQTREPVFDATLSHALAVQLAQSPFLNIVADDRVRETLPLMGRAPDERLTVDLARQVCQRLSTRAMVKGSISRLGSVYLLLVEAVDCTTGDSLAREHGEADGPEQVLETLGVISSRLRARLGESLRSLQRFDVPVARATTPSLAALRAYTLGIEERRRGAEVESIPFFLRALEIDPSFAAAATTLSTVYGNLGEASKSTQYARRAYASRERVSERERLLITYQYHDRVTGDQQAAADTLEVWQQTYPHDFQPSNALSILYGRLGRYDLAVEAAREALARTPGHPFALSNLGHAYRGLGRYAEAKKAAEQAVALGVETVPTRRLLYQLAVMDGDAAGAQRQLEWAKGNPREFDLVAAEAQVAAYQGRLHRASELYLSAVALAEQRGLQEVGSNYAAHSALTHALYGSRAEALALARAAQLRQEHGLGMSDSLPRLRVLVVLGLLDAPEAARVASGLADRHPDSTLTKGVVLPSTRAAIELARGRPAAAIDELRAALPYETGTVAVLIPTFLRGEAYLRAGQGPRALLTFLKILEHRGADPFSPVCALARLGVARAWLAVGNQEKAAQAYRELFGQWPTADPDLPVLVEARAEYQRLPTALRPR